MFAWFLDFIERIFQGNKKQVEAHELLDVHCQYVGAVHKDVTRQYPVKGRFPPEVRAQALFKCVQLQLPEVDDGENEFAYQATVKIAGHVFKGVLYDQGMDNGGSSVQHTNVADLQLGPN